MLALPESGPYGDEGGVTATRRMYRLVRTGPCCCTREFDEAKTGRSSPVGIEATSRLTQEQRTLVLKDIKVWLSSNQAGYPPDRLIAGALRSGLCGGPPISQPLAERESAAWVLFLHGVVLYSL